MLGFLRGLLLENLGIKLVALLLAVALYLHVYTERPATLLMTFPVQITDLADSLAISGPTPDPVQAELRGTGKQLIRLRLSEPRVKLSLAGVVPGHFERSLTVEDLPLMREDGVVVERLAGPRVIALDVERKAARQVPIAVRVAGLPRAGWTWQGGFAADPMLVKVSGPRHQVAHLDSVRLKPVRVEGKTDSVRAVVESDSLPRGCVMEPSTVRVVVALVKTAP